MSHGVSHLRVYHVWEGMMGRCYNPNHPSYARYGGRGITVCNEWHNSRTFIQWALTNGYRDTLTIDRIDNDGSYTPQNIRFTTFVVQSRNRSTANMLTAFGETKNLRAWLEDARCVVPETTLYNRLRTGWEVEDAIVTPSRTRFTNVYRRTITAFGEAKTMQEWASDLRCKVSYDALKARLSRGFSVEDAITHPMSVRRK